LVASAVAQRQRAPNAIDGGRKRQPRQRSRRVSRRGGAPCALHGIKTEVLGVHELHQLVASNESGALSVQLAMSCATEVVARKRGVLREQIGVDGGGARRERVVIRSEKLFDRRTICRRHG